MQKSDSPKEQPCRGVEVSSKTRRLLVKDWKPRPTPRSCGEGLKTHVEAFVIPKLPLAGKGESLLIVSCRYEREALFSQQPPSSWSCADEECIFFGFQPKIRGRTVLAGGRPVPAAYRSSDQSRQTGSRARDPPVGTGRRRTERANTRRAHRVGLLFVLISPSAHRPSGGESAPRSEVARG